MRSAVVVVVVVVVVVLSLIFATLWKDVLRRICRLCWDIQSEYCVKRTYSRTVDRSVSRAGVVRVEED